MTTQTAGGNAANRSGKITRDAVLATALEVIDRDRADALSMRRKARAVGRDPMILYGHAPNKAALLDGVAETVLAGLTSTRPTPTGRASCAPSPACLPPADGGRSSRGATGQPGDLLPMQVGRRRAVSRPAAARTHGPRRSSPGAQPQVRLPAIADDSRSGASGGSKHSCCLT